jgi:L-asparagine oxygenase
MLTVSRTAVTELTLPEPAKNAWLREASCLQYPDWRGAGEWRSFVTESAALAQAHLPFTALEALHEFFSPWGPDAFLIKNLPLDRHLPPTPIRGARPAGKSAVSEAVIAGIIEPHGAIVSYLNEKAGAPIHEIAPVAGLEHVASSAGRVSFAYHTDAAFLAPRFCPRGLLLAGLRNDSLAPTAEKPIFRHPAPASFNLNFAVTAPILWTDWRGMARIAIQTHAVQPLNEEAAEAVTQFRSLLGSIEPRRFVLAPGTALLFKNDRVLHGRDAFTGERWLQRAYFTDSLAPFQEVTGSRDDSFAFDARELV